MNKERILNVYCCSACSEVQVKTTTPKIRGCKVSSFHNWILLGEKGLNKYKCEGCGVKVNTIDMPLDSMCKDGKKHVWKKI
jgi:hypothetical protein